MFRRHPPRLSGIFHLFWINVEFFKRIGSLFGEEFDDYVLKRVLATTQFSNLPVNFLKSTFTGGRFVRY